MNSSDDFYTKFASEYANYASGKKVYISAVNSLICKESDSPLNIVDVGSGDGLRGKSIADSLDVRDVTFLDNSDGMLALSKQIEGVSVNKVDITSSEFIPGRKYDLVLCLWNVLGHISTIEGRKNAVLNLAKLLTNNGVLFIDVNNRYNSSHYGKMAVAKNMIHDVFKAPNLVGNFDLCINIESCTIKTSVHIFNPLEIEDLIESSGMVIERKWIVNYDTGKTEKHFWNGQLLFKIKPR